jgi:organic hydroperoxide reductase OsmC/OhrA
MGMLIRRAGGLAGGLGGSATVFVSGHGSCFSEYSARIILSRALVWAICWLSSRALSRLMTSKKGSEIVQIIVEVSIVVAGLPRYITHGMYLCIHGI